MGTASDRLRPDARVQGPDELLPWMLGQENSSVEGTKRERRSDVCKSKSSRAVQMQIKNAALL